MFIRLKGGPHLLQSYLCVAQDGLPHVAKEMLPSFESLVVTSALGLQVFFMDIHHDTSLRSILEDDSIFSASGVYICSCSGKGARLWLIARSSICLFCITHSTFTLALCFHFGLIYLLTFNFFTCECGHELDAFGTNLVRYPFGGQRIATHNAI
jgi:hypothetical protein